MSEWQGKDGKKTILDPQAYFEKIIQIIFAKYALLPVMSSLSAALLVVATFQEKLIPLTSFVKFLLVTLLAIIPISIWGYLKRLEYDNEFLTIVFNDPDAKPTKSGDLVDRITKALPTYLFWVLCGVIIAMIFVIICNWNNDYAAYQRIGGSLPLS
jgi:hypothetical protein